VTDDFWPLFRNYLSQERQADETTQAAWVSFRRGRGKPLTYAAFESSLRYVGRKIGANVHAHMFRHALAQALVDNGDLKTAQDVLGHRHVTTTADTYVHTDEPAMAKALAAARTGLDVRTPIDVDPGRVPPSGETLGSEANAASRAYVFPYDAGTIAELDQVSSPGGDGRTRREGLRGRLGRHR
jgi:hypothetical protein